MSATMRTSTLAVLLALAVPPAARADAPPALPRPEIVEWTLDNGLDVVYVGVHRAPVVTVQIWYHVGSKDEARTQRGSAHMFEHMMFKGTRNVPPEEHARLLDRVGGETNAFTTEDVTAYHDTVPRAYLDFAVRLEAERMRNLLFRADMVKTEREVVKEEKRAKIDNSPIGKALEQFRAKAYTRHPYAWLAAGDAGDLDRLGPAELKKFYDTYYVPNNATLIVVGDVTEAEVRASAQKWFGPVPRGAEPPRPSHAAGAVEPPQTQARRVTAGAGQLGVIIGGYHIPPARSPDMVALDVLALILANGESSRLHRRVVSRDKIGVYAGGGVNAFEDPGLLLVIGAYLDAAQGAKVEAALADEVARFGTEKVSERELEKARNQLAAQLVFGLESVGGLASAIGDSKVDKGDARAWLLDYDRYLAVTADDVMRVAKTYLVPENLTLVVVPPAAGGAR